MFRVLIVIAAISATAMATLSATAVAATPVAGTATLAAPAALARIVTEDGNWSCAGAACAGTADNQTAAAVAICTAITDRAGRVAASSAGETAFAAAELLRCNRHEKG